MSLLWLKPIPEFFAAVLSHVPQELRDLQLERDHGAVPNLRDRLHLRLLCRKLQASLLRLDLFRL